MSPKELFEQLYRENYSKLASYCYFYLKNKHDTEDVVQDTFLKAWNQINSSHTEIKKAWLYIVAKNQIMNRFKSYEHIHKSDSRIIENAVASEDFEEQVVRQDDFSQIKQALETLPFDQKEAIILKFVQELDYSEIAEIMQKTINSVRVLIHRGLAALKIEAESNQIKSLPILFTPAFILQSQQTIFNQLVSKLSIKPLIMNPDLSAPVTKVITLSTAKLVTLITTIAVLVGGAAAGITYVVTSSNNKSMTNSNNTATVATSITQSSVPVVTTVVSSTEVSRVTTALPSVPNSAYKTYTNNNLKYSFEYPADWQITEFTVKKGQELNKDNKLTIFADPGDVYVIDVIAPDKSSVRMQLQKEFKADSCLESGNSGIGSIDPNDTKLRFIKFLDVTIVRDAYEIGATGFMGGDRVPPYPLIIQFDLGKKNPRDIGYILNFCYESKVKRLQMEFAYYSPSFTDQNLKNKSIDPSLLAKMDKILASVR